MLDDVSTEGALALLSVSEDADEASGPRGWSRRRFLQAIGAGLLGGAAIGPVADELMGEAHAWAAPIGPDDGVLVLVTLYGGFDGLNTVVPYTNGTYMGLRGGLAVPANQVLAIDGSIGLAPQLPYLKQLYDAGSVAIVQGVGYANPDLSHFTSMAIWMHGNIPGGPPMNGWVGRWLDGLPADSADLAAATLDQTVPLHLRGIVRRGVGIPPDGNMFGGSGTAADGRLFHGLRSMSDSPSGRGTWHDKFTATMASQLELATLVAPTMALATPTGGELCRKLTIAARLLNADLGLRVVDVGANGFDTHENQMSVLSSKLTDLDDGLHSFFDTLSPAMRDRVTVVVMSEFGRTVAANGSGGTDHGTSNPVFVIGTNVRGGLHGQMPSLTSLNGTGRMHAHVDFRSVYGSVIDGWMGGGASSVLNGSFTDLDLFARGPGATAPPASTPIIVVPPVQTPAPTYDRSALGGYSPLEPQRILDTRDGTGGRGHPLGSGELMSVALAGRYGIPDDATAVVVNITAIRPTEATYLLMWNGEVPRPEATSVTALPGRATAGLTVCQLNDVGQGVLYNHAGDVDLVFDLVGYFSPTAPLRLASWTTRRLIDTRDVNWPIGEGQVLEVPVRGWAGVSAGAEVAIVNLTITEATRDTFLSVTRSIDGAPEGSTINTRAGDTTANLAFVALGERGTIRLRNHAGDVHIVIDVLGSFAPDGDGWFRPHLPSRVFDSRAPDTDLANGAKIEMASRTTDGIAQLATVTAVTPSVDSYVNVAQAGDGVGSSNVNVAAHEIATNLFLSAQRTDTVELRTNADHVHVVIDSLGEFVHSADAV